MNWIEHRIGEAREKKLPKLELIGDFTDKSVLPPSLVSAVFELKHLRSLTLNGVGFPEIPEEIGELTELEELNLSWIERFGPPRALETLKKLKKLMLRGMSLHSVPFDLTSLPELEELNLSFNSLEFLPDSLLSLKKLVALDLNGNDFATVPEILGSMRSLKQLSFGTPKYKDKGLDVRPLGKLLKQLQLSVLQLSDVPIEGCIQSLGEMVSLEEISFWDEALTRFPIELARLPNLRALGIHSEVSLDIPDSVLGFQGLRELSLISSPKTGKKKRAKVSKRLLDLQGLEKLWLDYRNGESINRDFFKLGALRELALIDCDIGELPPTVQALQRLESLNLARNALPGLPQELFRLAGLKSLWLYGTGIQTVPREISNLSALTTLSIGACGVMTLPSAIFQLRHLQTLVVSENQLTELPRDIGELKELEELKLDRNQIRQLPKAIGSLTRLRYLDVTNNPIESPPPEIVAQGTIGIQNYFSAIVGMPVERLFEAKLLIVGEGAVGKTCLAKKLVDPECDLEQPQEKIHSTEGIEIRTWEVATPQTEHFRVNLWDFGGQEIYHATHQFFLTKRSLYLFVWDARKEDRTGGFDYWLNVVRLLSAGSPVIVALNKADERIKEIDEADLKKHFPNVQEFHKVSALKGTGMEVLRDRIAGINE